MSCSTLVLLSKCVQRGSQLGDTSYLYYIYKWVSLCTTIII